MLLVGCGGIKRQIWFVIVMIFLVDCEVDDFFDDIIVFVWEFVFVEILSCDMVVSVWIVDIFSCWFVDVGGIVQWVDIVVGMDFVIDVFGSGDFILLIGYIDIVWFVGMFEVDVFWLMEGDVVCGFGVYDMKVGIVVMFEVLCSLQLLFLFCC